MDTPVDTIPFRRYHLPNGRQTEEVFSCANEEVVRQAQTIIDQGYRFECEFLRTGEFSVTCFDIEDEVDICIEFVPLNSSPAPFIEKLVADAYAIISPSSKNNLEG